MKIAVTFLSILFCAFISVAQVAKPIRLSELKQKMTTADTQIQVYNFWATWCGPCVKELPLFETAHQKKIGNIQLVSLDYDLNPDIEHVNKFIQKRNITSPVLFLTEEKPNAWIDQIESTWSGAIPATLVINTKTGKRIFMEGMVKEGQLEKWIEELK